jgi:hypothetical protein
MGEEACVLLFVRVCLRNTVEDPSSVPFQWEAFYSLVILLQGFCQSAVPAAHSHKSRRKRWLTAKFTWISLCAFSLCHYPRLMIPAVQGVGGWPSSACVAGFPDSLFLSQSLSSCCQNHLGCRHQASFLKTTSFKALTCTDKHHNRLFKSQHIVGPLFYYLCNCKSFSPWIVNILICKILTRHPLFVSWGLELKEEKRTC